MPKNKRPAPRKPDAPAPAADIDTLAQGLVDLALEISEREGDDAAVQATLAAREEELATQVRRLLRRKHDEVLYGAIELARFTDPGACRHLRETIEEEAATLRVRGDKEGDAEFEIDAFMIPLFVHSTGGLVEAEVFRDDADFEALTDSFRQSGLASADTRLVLVRHLYDLDAVDRIRYGDMQEILREVAGALRSKKMVATPLIEAGMRPWQASGYDASDEAMELRYLLGFSLKRVDDPFYQVPADDAGAEAYFEARMARYRMWAGSVGALIARSLSVRPAGLDVNFLYQDLFFGAKEQGIHELAMLATLAEVNARLDESDRDPARVKAVVAPIEQGGEAVLRINLYPLAGGAPLATIDKPFDIAADLETELDDICDALGTLGLDGVLLASGFDESGEPEGVEPFLGL